jgi:S-methylmethionine-dependent homocysteine/selenocysteine methylase
MSNTRFAATRVYADAFTPRSLAMKWKEMSAFIIGGCAGVIVAYLLAWYGPTINVG